MTTWGIPYEVVLFLFAGAFLFVGWQAQQRREAPGSVPLALFMLSIAIWSVCLGFEYSLTSIPNIFLFAKIEYLGLVSAPIFLLWFAAEFFGQRKLEPQPWHAALWAVPLIIVALAFTNEFHHLIWTDLSLRLDSGTHRPVFEHGPWFWLFVAYNYLILMIASGLIIRSALKLRHIFRSQALAMVIALPFPWLANILYVFKLPAPGLDFTPVGLGITGTILVWAMHRLQLFDLAPVAREQVVEWLDDGLVVFNRQRQLVDLNPAAERLLGRLREAGSPTENRRWIGQTAADLKAHFSQLIELFERQTDGRFDVQLQVDGRELDYDVRISTLKGKRGGVQGWMMVLRDITDLKTAREAAYQARDQAVAAADENARLYEQLKQMAVTDSLTGVNIRRHFYEQAGFVLDRAAESRQPASLLLFDLDHFKSVNDTYGHSTGDRMLQQVAQICIDSLRRKDILGRYGGDEFVALLPETDLPEAVRVANRLCAQIATAPFEASGSPLRFTISVGVSTLLGGEDTLDALIDRADRAMYRAKQTGRNRVVTGD